MLAQHHQYMNICQHTTTPTQTAISFISFTLSFCLLHRIPHTPASARHRNKRNSCTIPASPSSSVLFLRCNKNLGAYSVSKPTAYGVSLQRQQAYSVSVSLQQQRQPTAAASAYCVSLQRQQQRQPTASASLQRQQAYSVSVSLQRQQAYSVSVSLQQQRQPTATASAYCVSLQRQQQRQPTASASLQRQQAYSVSVSLQLQQDVCILYKVQNTHQLRNVGLALFCRLPLLQDEPKALLQIDLGHPLLS